MTLWFSEFIRVHDLRLIMVRPSVMLPSLPFRGGFLCILCCIFVIFVFSLLY